MRRILIYALILAVLCIVPVKGQDVADLEPIQSVWLSREGNLIVLETDTGDKGGGNTVTEALEEMKRQSPGIIYLDTAQYLLVSEKALDAVEAIRPYLKGKVRVCLWEGGKLQNATKYMQAHEIGIRLRKWRTGDKLPKMPLNRDEK